MTKQNQLSLDLLKNLNFCVFDLETTGGNHKSDKIIEIGLVKIQNLEITEKKEFLVNPQIRIPDFIQKLTNIKQSHVEDAPLIENIIDEILEFMGDSILVAHNTSFDVPFFNSVLRRLDRSELENKSICTNLMTKYLIPNLLNSNLNYMCKIFNIKHKKAHRALDDALATAELLQRYLRIFISKGIQKINHLYYPRNRYELDRVHYKACEDFHSKEDIEKKLTSLKSPFLVTVKGEDGIILFALPCKGSVEERNFILDKIEALDWKTTTIKLFGPFIEAIIHFNNLFSKIDPQLRSEAIHFLWKTHLPKQKKTAFEARENEGHVLDREFGDFLVVNHLVPEQMLILPVQALHPKSQLIFRFPSHKKKLLQYINSKSSRISNNKLKGPHFHPLLKEFVDFYLKELKESEKECFIFRKKAPLTRPDDFIKELETFLAKNPNPYHYPKDYI